MLNTLIIVVVAILQSGVSLCLWSSQVEYDIESFLTLVHTIPHALIGDSKQICEKELFAAAFQLKWSLEITEVKVEHIDFEFLMSW